MKKLLFILVLITGLHSVKAQSWCTAGSVWYYTAPIGGSGNEYVKQIYLKDTLVGTTIYNKISGELHTSTVQYINIYTTKVNNVIFYNAQALSTPAAIDTLIYFGQIGSKWRTSAGAGTNCAKSFVEITDTGTTNVQGVFLKWRKINYTNYYNLTSTNPSQISVAGVDTIFERIGYKHIAFQYPHCSDMSQFATTYNFKCFQDNQLFVSSVTGKCAYDVGIKEEQLNAEISIYPNPSQSTVSLRSKHYDLANSTIKITNQIGQLVVCEEYIHSISIEHLSAGLYTMLIKLKDGTIVSKKLIKE